MRLETQVKCPVGAQESGQGRQIRPETGDTRQESARDAGGLRGRDRGRAGMQGRTEARALNGLAPATTSPRRSRDRGTEGLESWAGDAVTWTRGAQGGLSTLSLTRPHSANLAWPFALPSSALSPSWSMWGSDQLYQPRLTWRKLGPSNLREGVGPRVLSRSYPE